MAAFIAAILAGLIPNSTEAIEPYGKNPNPSIEIVERSLKISGGDQSKTGPGARAKADARARAKTQPGVADAFVPQRNYWPYQKPLSAKKTWKDSKGSIDPDQEQGKGTICNTV